MNTEHRREVGKFFQSTNERMSSQGLQSGQTDQTNTPFARTRDKTNLSNAGFRVIAKMKSVDLW